MTLYQPTIEMNPSAYIVGITTLKVDTELLEGYLVLYNPKHREMIGESELFQQGFKVTDHADELSLKPEWIRHMAFRLNIRKRYLNLKINRNGVVADDQLKQLRESIGQLIISFYRKNPIGLSQYLNDGRKNVLSEYESEMQLVQQALFVSVYLKGQEVELTMETILNGFLGREIRIAFISHELFDYYRRQYPTEYKNFLKEYQLIVFEKNREFFTQFLAPYCSEQHYVVSKLPGIVYIEMSADMKMRKNISPYRRGYQAYPEGKIQEEIFCFVANEQSGPFHIILNRNHRNVQLLAQCHDNPKVSNLREVIIENIKQRIINSQNHWDKIIDFGGSFVDEWTSGTPMSVQAVWCLENDFADSVNRFIDQKLGREERARLGLGELIFQREDFISWWYTPHSK